MGSVSDVMITCYRGQKKHICTYFESFKSHNVGAPSSKPPIPSLHSFDHSLKTKKARFEKSYNEPKINRQKPPNIVSSLSINNAMYVKNYPQRQTDATGCIICAAEDIVSTTNDICLSTSALFLARYASTTPGKGVPELVNTCLIR